MAVATHDLAFILNEDGLSIGPKSSAPKGIDVGNCCDKIIVFEAGTFIQATLRVNVTDFNVQRIQALCTLVDPKENADERTLYCIPRKHIPEQYLRALLTEKPGPELDEAFDWLIKRGGCVPYERQKK